MAKFENLQGTSHTSFTIGTGATSFTIDNTGTITAPISFTHARTNAAAAVNVSSTVPAVRLVESDAAANEQQWEIHAVGGELRIVSQTDAGASGATAIALNRTGTTVDLISLAATEVDLTATTLDFNGTADISGTLTVNNNLTVNSLNTILSSTSGPLLRFNDSDATSGARNWRLRGNNTQFSISTEDDTFVLVENALVITANGSSQVTQITWAGDEFQIDAPLDLNGNLDVSGTSLFTGATTFTTTATFNRSGLEGAAYIASASAFITYDDTDAAADESLWSWGINSNLFRLVTMADATPTTIAATPFSVTRSGTAATIVTLTGTTVDLNGNLDLDGTTHTLDGTTITVDAVTTLNLAGGSAAVTLSGTEVDLTATTIDINGNLDALTVTGAGTGSSAIYINNALPRIAFDESDAAADNQVWYIDANAEQFAIAAVNDALDTTSDAIRIDRTGLTIDLVQLLATEVDLTATTIDANGNLDLDGTTHTLDGTTITIDAVTTYNLAGGSATVTLAGTEVDLTATTLDFNGAMDLSGQGVFNSTGAGTASSAISIVAAAPFLNITETDQAADATRWLIGSSAGELHIGPVADAATSPQVSQGIHLTRSTTTVTEIQLDATALDFNGTADFSSTVVVNSVLTTSGTTPITRIFETDGAVDEKNWLIWVGGGIMRIGTLATDAAPTSDSGVTPIIIDRTAATTTAEIEMNATLFDFNGNADISGTLLVGGAITGSLTGNASTATTLQTARDFTIGNTARSFNGSAAVSWNKTDIGVHAEDVLTLAGTAGTPGYIWLTIPTPSGGATYNIAVQNGASSIFDARIVVKQALVSATVFRNFGWVGDAAWCIEVTGTSTTAYIRLTVTAAAAIDLRRCHITRHGATTTTGVSVSLTDPGIVFGTTDTDSLRQGQSGGSYTITGSGETLAIFADDGAVTLYHNNVAKLDTKVDGVNIVGELEADSLDIDGNADISGTLAWGGGAAIASSNNVVSTTNANTFTQKNTFTSSGFVHSTTAILLDSTVPSLGWYENDTAVDEKRWAMAASGGNFSLSTLTDADAFGATCLSIQRTGTTVDEIEMNATAFDFNGTMDVSGSFQGTAGAFSTSLSSATLTTNAATPSIFIIENDAAANNGVWTIRASAEQFAMNASTDALAHTAFMTVDRTGSTVDSINLIATTLTKGGSTIWHAGNDGAGSGLDADLLDGLNAAEAATGSTIVQRHASGYIFATYYNASNGNNENPTISQVWTDNGSDGYMRRSSLYHTMLSGGFINNQTAASFTYGGYYLGSAIRNTYYGLGINDGTHIPTFMSNGTTLGVYMQGTAANWMIYYTHGSGTVTTPYDFTANSDIRLKTDVEVIPDALAKVKALTGYTFTKSTPGGDVLGRRTGVIAQEVEKVLPEAVTDDVDGYKGVAYGNMVGLLIEAIKELEAQVAELRAQK